LKKEDASTEKSSILSELLVKSKLAESKGISTISSPIAERTKSIQDLFVKSAVDISALLPPGYKPGKYTWQAKFIELYVYDSGA
jgi:hypothetical protein